MSSLVVGFNCVRIIVSFKNKGFPSSQNENQREFLSNPRNVEFKPLMKDMNSLERQTILSVFER